MMAKVILHTEASLGFGGQELRILKEARHFREMGATILLAAHPESKLYLKMKEEGFLVFPVYFKKKNALACLLRLLFIIKKHKVDIINTHSSTDAWMGGIAGKITNRPIIRTRHLSTKIKKGINSRLLYNTLVDYVVTTCEEIVPMIRTQARLKNKGCKCIATGVEVDKVHVNQEDVALFRSQYGIKEDDVVIGTLCVLRSWKGLSDLTRAAHILKEIPHLKWLIVGSGGMEEILLREIEEYGLQGRIILTGHISEPFLPLAAMDIFSLLSTSNEGISQASLQAAYLKKPLITTSVGGLPEICLPNRTGIVVEKNNPLQVAEAVRKLLDPDRRELYGKNAHQLVLEKFTFQKTIEETLHIYNELLRF